MPASLFMLDSHFQVVTKLFGPLHSTAKNFDPSEYITPVDQPKPMVTIIEDDHVMFVRTIYEEKVEGIIEEEGLRRVPVYFYDPHAPTDDYCDKAEIEAQLKEITTIANQMALQDLQGDNDESANQDDSEVLMINLSDEKVCSELIVDAEKEAYPNWTVEHTLKYKIKNANSDPSFDSDSDSESTQSESSVSSFQTTEFGEKNLVKVPRHNIYFKFDSEMSFDNFSNEKEDLEYFTLSTINYVFAWTYEDMPGIDPEIVQHKIPLHPYANPVKQKLRRMCPDWVLKIKEKVTKQINFGFLIVTEYPQWVANIVPVPKKTGGIKIMMSHEDREKTTFTTPWGTYCYRVMPFGLKNAGATYQRMATTLLRDMMHEEVEVYVDNMIVKLKERERHYEALQKFFERIRQYKLRLNPQKCTLGVTAGKMLGFLITQRGIEVDPSKIQAIVQISPPKTEKEVRSFLGKVQFISRFISKRTAIYEPLFKLLKKGTNFEWNQDCQQAFEAIKEYLQNPHVLSPPILGKPLILYLSVTDTSMGCMLAQENNAKVECAIYYLSKKMTDYETRYTPLEKTCWGLVWATMKLRHYLLAHPVVLVSRLDPIKYFFEKLALIEKLARWLLLLVEFDLKYMTRKSVKGRAVAEFLADHPVIEAKLYFDGASNQRGYGIGVLLVSPYDSHIPLSYKLRFEVTNNQAEYEACIAGMEAAPELRAKRVEVIRDSNLVVSQARGD
ncbi:uncharacterized protein LOC131309457 [Rhododendron vialii]|uniref:uncharacterized protein LOC131309457 n=1 Tax=Rhododendron vialii TaxID=182163 RepID=UPI00265E5DE3|nr:uncharacterized protein LOC131309457 [Rhododendron vialii]